MTSGNRPDQIDQGPRTTTSAATDEASGPVPALTADDPTSAPGDPNSEPFNEGDLAGDSPEDGPEDFLGSRIK